MRIKLEILLNMLYISRISIPIKPKQIAIVPIVSPHAYNIRNIAIVHISPTHGPHMRINTKRTNYKY